MKFQLIFMDGATMEMTVAKSLRTVAHALLNVPYADAEPLKFISISTGKQFYFDKQVLEAFINEELTEPELIEKLECDGLFRNTQRISVDNSFIEVDHLFIRKGNQLHLVDDDVCYIHHLPDENFVEV